MEIVNGYVCQSCCDAGLASRNIDPAHPKDGPYGENKTSDSPDKPSKSGKPADPAHGPAVVLGGALATAPAGKTGQIGQADKTATPGDPTARPPGAAGLRLDLSA